jgi:hypothetical protein
MLVYDYPFMQHFIPEKWNPLLYITCTYGETLDVLFEFCMGTSSFAGMKSLGVVLTTHPLRVPRLRMG